MSRESDLLRARRIALDFLLLASLGTNIGLERNLRMESAIRDLVNEFSARTPTPAAGALSLSQGAALGVKVVRFAWTGRAGAEVKASLPAAEDELLRVVEGALPKFEEDCRAVRALVSHFRASREGRRPEDVELDDAILVPSGLLSLASEGLAALERVIGIVKRALLCEAGASASLVWTAAGGLLLDRAEQRGMARRR